MSTDGKPKDRLPETGAETSDYLDTVQDSPQHRDQTESIWTIRGQDPVTTRALTLAEQAEECLLHAADDASPVTEGVVAAFEATVDRGVRVVLTSANRTVLDRAGGPTD